MAKRKQVRAKREPHQKKQVVLKQQSRRNQPELYAEKKTKANFSITLFARNSLNDRARESGLSMSEYLERLLRWVADPAAQEDFAQAHKFIIESDPLKGQRRT